MTKRFRMEIMIGLGGVAVALVAFAPRVAAGALPLLLILACPLLMMGMMGMMGGMGGGGQRATGSSGGPLGADGHDEPTPPREEIKMLDAKHRSADRTPQG